MGILKHRKNFFMSVPVTFEWVKIICNVQDGPNIPKNAPTRCLDVAQGWFSHSSCSVGAPHIVTGRFRSGEEGECAQFVTNRKGRTGGVV